MRRPYTVLDFTDERGEIGPMLMGDLSADVIRVELPGGNRARSATLETGKRTSSSWASNVEIGQNRTNS